MTFDPRYPIGKFEPRETYTPEEIQVNIERIQHLPGKMESAIRGLDASQLDTPYRDGGWSIRQVVHHTADSHMNAYIRFKWTLTEETPLIKAYQEKLWAETSETKEDPVYSIALLKSLHTKWVFLLKGLTTVELHREFIHPDTKKKVPLDRLVAMYAWHGEHHLSHITTVKTNKNWL